MKNKKRDQIKKLKKEILLNKVKARPGVFELVLILDHLKSGFNIAKIFRTAEIFSIKKIYIVGTRDFNPFPAKGAIRRVPFEFLSSIDDAVNELFENGYGIYNFDATGKLELHRTKFSNKTAFILGNEEIGSLLPKSLKEKVKNLKIRQYGLSQSLNVSIAASIACYEYVRQFDGD